MFTLHYGLKHDNIPHILIKKNIYKRNYTAINSGNNVYLALK